MSLKAGTYVTTNRDISPYSRRLAVSILTVEAQSARRRRQSFGAPPGLRDTPTAKMQQ